MAAAVQRHGLARALVYLAAASAVGICLGLSVGVGLSVGYHTLFVRPGAAAAAAAWGGSQRTVEPLYPGTRPIRLKDEGDQAAMCRLTGWPNDERCLGSGLSPRLDFGTKPTLVSTHRYHRSGFAAVLAYTDATDQTSRRWVAVSLFTQDDGSWHVRTFADVPVSDTPDADTVRGVLDNSRRCNPSDSLTGC